jgi:hypothetical protein
MHWVHFGGNKLDLAEQFLNAGGCEEHLGLSKIEQLTSRPASTDPPLVTAETTEQALQFQIILGQS